MVITSTSLDTLVIGSRQDVAGEGGEWMRRRWPVDGLGGPLGGLAVFVHGFSFFLFLFDLPRGGHLTLLGK